jgi:uncharacterized delta-60 repeat protein
MRHWAGVVVSVAGRLPECGLRFAGAPVWLLVASLVLGQIALAQSPGALDAAFTPSITGVVHAVAVQSNGQIVIGGEFTSVNGAGRSNLARLNADGTLDTSFNPGIGGGLSPGVFALAIQSDGRILIGGRFSTVNGVGRNNIARLNANGTLDGSFNPGTGISGFFPHKSMPWRCNRMGGSLLVGSSPASTVSDATTLRGSMSMGHSMKLQSGNWD